MIDMEHKRRKSLEKSLENETQTALEEKETSEPHDIDDVEDEDFEEEDDAHVSEEEEEEEEEEGIFVGGKLLRPRKHSHGSSNRRYSNSIIQRKSRNLREKKPINYASQMYPQAFKEVEQLEYLDRNNMLPSKEASRSIRAPWTSNRSHSNHKLFRLNEVRFTSVF